MNSAAKYPGLFLVAALGLVIALAGCNNTKHLQEGEQLYTGAKVKLESPYSIVGEAALRDEIDEVVKPDPNAKILGMRPSLWMYNLINEPKKDKGLKYFLKYKIGRPPVLMQDVRPASVSNLINNRLYNNGYFNSTVDYSLSSDTLKKVKVFYRAELGRPYVLDTILFRKDTTAIGREIRQIADETVLQRGQQYQLQNFQEERERIDYYLKDHGYFYFNGEYLKFDADTTVGDKRMNVFIRKSPTIPKEATEVYRLGEISIYPNYTLGQDNDSLSRDSMHHDGLVVYEKHAEHLFRPKALKRSIFIQEGDRYSRRDHELTLNRLMGLGAFKFVDVRFNQSEDSSDAVLNAAIYLTPMDKKTIRAELEMVTKSNNFIGPGLKGTWTNRNTFGGAELLQININGGVETQLGGSSGEESNFGEFISYRLGLGAELQVPRFLTPFNIKYNSMFVPKTKIKGNYELVNRVRYFMLNSVSSSYGYSWKPNAPIRHELEPIAVSFSQLTNTTPEFDELLDNNQFLANSFAERFIIGPQYEFVYNDQVRDELRNHVYYSGGADISNPFGVLGDVAATYARFTSDFRYYFKLTKESKLVGRVYAGVGLPYGNSEQLPYIKQFFAGGPNGVRAFRARSIGPGEFNPQESDLTSTGFLDQNGDIKLLFNLEYRFKIYGAFHGAVYGDAGNIWLLNENAAQPGGAFEDDFMQELAVGAGVGLRVDLSFFLIRLDVALPLRKPYFEENDGWVTSPFQERPMFNLAIGYPF